MNIDRVRIKRKSNDFYRNQSTIFETSDTGQALSRHEEAQRRREVRSLVFYTILLTVYNKVQMRARRDKLLHDVEKSDRLSREAKRRNRHSWGGNINGKIFLYKKDFDISDFKN